MDKNPRTIFEFNGSAVKVCRSQGRGRQRVLTHCFYFDIAGKEDGDIARCLRRELEKNRCEARNAVLSLPRYAACSLFFRLPSRDPREIVDMVLLRLAREAGARGRGEFLRAFAVAGFDAEGHALVSAWLFPKERFLRYMTILDGAGIALSAVTMYAAGIFGLLRGSGRRDEAFVFLHADSDALDFYAVVNGIPVMSRTLGPVGAPPAAGHAGLARELKVSVEAARRLTGKVFPFPETCYVMGAEKAARDILSEESLPYATQGLNVFDGGIRCRAGVVSFEDAGVSLAPVAALALGYGQGIFDMTPDEVRASRARDRRKRLRFFLLARMTAAAMVLALLFARYSQQRMDVLREMRGGLAAMAPLERLMRDAALSDALDKKLRGNEAAAELFDELRVGLAAGVDLEALEWKESGVMKLEGRAVSAPALLRSYEAFYRRPRFSRLRLEYTREKSGPGLSFRIYGVFR